MDLLARILAQRRDRLLVRLGCWLVCCSVIVGLMLPAQRAKALVGELSIAAVASVAAAYLGACGLSFVTQGMDRDALVNSTQRLIQEFLDTELGGITIQDWLGGVWDIVVMAGKLVLGRPLTDEFMSFAQWVAGKYATQAGENAVYNETSSYVTLADGSKFYLCTGFDPSTGYFSNPGTPILPEDNTIVFSTGYSVVLNVASDSVYFYDPEGNVVDKNEEAFTYLAECWPFYIGLRSFVSGGHSYVETIFLYHTLFVGSRFTSFHEGYIEFDIGASVEKSESLGIDRAETVQQILDRLTALEEGQSVALDVGAAQSMEIQEILQGILDAVLAGDLASTAEIVDEAAEPVDPPAGEIPDVDSLGLPALGEALTTRFPFSIPWDFFRAVKLLAAPAKAPYFEVDFLEPLADEVGGWKGSTTVVLDFSQYAIIGQVCRWTSTIGFCLMLAGATKRLIWTA